MYSDTLFPTITALMSTKSLQNDRVRWWPICTNDHEYVGKVLVSIGSTFTSDETVLMKV